MPMVESEISRKVLDIFPDRGIIVDKSLACFNEQFRKLPAFVTDFLISAMVDPSDPTPGLERIAQLLQNHFIGSDQKELVKSKIREQGEFTIIGRLRCRYDEGKDEYWGDVAALGNQYVRIDPYIIAEHGDVLLTTGAWGSIRIVFEDNFAMKSKLFPFLIMDFRPMQVTDIDVDAWIQRRGSFTTDEWIDLLISSIGFDPACLTDKEKMLYLIRLIPFIESNVNLCELGPPETGKSYTYQSLSSYGYVISGSQTTIASLFYDKLRSRLGIAGYKDVLLFDEIAGANWAGQDDMVSMLKDFMNSGRFGRGTAEFTSDCSMVFAGNIDCDRDGKCVRGHYRNLFSPLPQIVNRDRAFLDRIHGFIPGWSVPQIKEARLAKGLGFLADYFGEVMHRMRDRSYAHVITGNVDFGDMGQRNQRSLVRISCGLMKLIYPHRSADTVLPEELKEVLDVALDLRQRVVEQLAVIAPSEFGGVKLEYRING